LLSFFAPKGVKPDRGWSGLKMEGELKERSVCFKRSGKQRSEKRWRRVLQNQVEFSSIFSFCKLAGFL
jgi:hypothetical protein